MSPPYVSTHPRVVLAEPVWGTENRCGVLIEFATPIPEQVADRLPAGVVGWQRRRNHDGDDGPFYPSEGHDRLVAYGRLAVRIPVPVELLPAPSYTDTGVAEMDTAKRAVRTISNYANSVLAPLVVHLDTDTGGMAGDATGHVHPGLPSA